MLADLIAVQIRSKLNAQMPYSEQEARDLSFTDRVRSYLPGRFSAPHCTSDVCTPCWI